LRLSYFLIFVVVFAVYLISSFDVCWVDVSVKGADKGFIFDSSWTEHLHSSEEWAIFYQIQAFSQGRAWLSQGSRPPNTLDVFKIGNKYYAYAEPMTAIALLPFYCIGNMIAGQGYLIRSVLVGMTFYTCLAALLVQRISLQLDLNPAIADLSALLFAFTTMAFSYSRLLYPQPIFCLLMLATILFLFRYKKKRTQNDLVCSAFFYGLSVFSFNAVLITVPIFLYFLCKIGLRKNRKMVSNIVLGLLPGAFLCLFWNYTITGNPMMTLRQYIYPSITFQVLYTTSNGVWLNLEGVFGQLFSPVGVFFVSPILFASIFGYFILKSKVKEESLLLASLMVIFWLFISFAAHPGNVTARDFWIGGWASIARYMYFPSAILVIFVSFLGETIHERRRVFVAWLFSLLVIISFLANMTYGIHHDLMIGNADQIESHSLLIWPYPQTQIELVLFAVVILLLSLVYPIFLAEKDNKITFIRRLRNAVERKQVQKTT